MSSSRATKKKINSSYLLTYGSKAYIVPKCNKWEDPSNKVYINHCNFAKRYPLCSMRFIIMFGGVYCDAQPYKSV